MLTFNKKEEKTLKTNNLFFVNQTSSIKRNKFNFYCKEKKLDRIVGESGWIL